jgi:hypothetical protein
MPPITTPQENFRKASAASVPATYNAASAVLTTTVPSSGTSGTGNVLLFDITSASVSGQNASLLYVMPFIVVAGTPSNTTIGMRIIGWRKYLEAAGTTFWYIPTVLADLTLGFTSPASSTPSYTIDSVANTRTFSSITQVSGTPSGNLYSPATAASSNVEPAYAMIDLAGAQYVTAQFKSSGTPDMGAFWSTL